MRRLKNISAAVWAEFQIWKKKLGKQYNFDLIYLVEPRNCTRYYKLEHHIMKVQRVKNDAWMTQVRYRRLRNERCSP